MTVETFGQQLRRLRRARIVMVSWPYNRHGDGQSTASVTGPMSQNELARRAGVDAALVNRLERDATHPGRATVLALACALEVDDVDTSRLLIAAGYWPWPDLTDDKRDEIIGAIVRVTTIGADPSFIRRRTG